MIEHIGKFSSKNYLSLSKNKKYAVLVEDIRATTRFTQIVDIFQEQEIIRAHYNGMESLDEAWARTQDQNPLNDSPKQLIQQRQILQGLTKPISRFRPTLMIIFIKTFRPHYILDFCAGWGDRLLGALMYNDKLKYYCGIDPNKSLFKGYHNMIQTLIPEKKDRKKYDMICGCGEDPGIIPRSPAKNGLYDMVITSPPYYDHEIYEPDMGLSDQSFAKVEQSIIKYKTLESWYNGFLLPATMNAIKSLSIGGYLVISINDTGIHNYTTRYFDDVTKLPSMRYIELFYNVNSVRYEGYIQEKKHTSGPNVLTGCQPIFVWQKISH